MKRLVFAVIVAAGVWLTIEAIFFVAFGIVDGETFRYEALREEQRRIAGEVAAEPEEEDAAEPGTLAPGSPLRAQAVHPYLGFVFDPIFTGAYRGSHALLGLRVNEWGFNDEEPPFRERSPDRLVVGVLGGSVARLLARRGGRALAESLASQPVFAGREVVIVCLAVDGFKQPQQLMAVSYLLSQGASFDVLVNLDGFNEVALYEAENERADIHPSYPRAWSSFAGKVPDLETREAIGRASFARDLRRDTAAGLLGSPLRASVAVNFLWRVFDRRLAGEVARANERLGEGTDDPRYTVRGPAYESASPEALYADLAAIWRESSVQLDALARANDIAYFHFLQPNQYAPISKPMSAAERSRAFDEEHPYRPGVRRGYPLLLRESSNLRERGVRFHDLTGLFRRDPEPVYVDDCCHVNDRGNRALAEAIATFIGETLAREAAG